eukprot:TRINITY_DN34513_c0_g1_i1.p1 TRINITY_DN34513_c0_g1~~TRINITY_DN34513_c0_g1_i1.p1  ORF type:complete len:645 (-),score=71.44 TRINITY_DN34513_c0_g1_i1:82-2016(-)
MLYLPFTFLATLLSWEGTIVVAERPGFKDYILETNANDEHGHSLAQISSAASASREIQEIQHHHSKTIDQALEFQALGDQLESLVKHHYEIILKEQGKAVLAEEASTKNLHRQQSRWSNSHIVEACLVAISVVIVLRLGAAAFATGSQDATASTSAIDVGKDDSSGNVVGKIFAIAGSQMIPNLCAEMVNLVSMLLVAQRKQSALLAAIGLANVCFNGVVQVVFAGGIGGIGAFVSQAHGANEHRLCCEYVQTFTLILTGQLIWVLPAFWFSDTWLVHLGQDAEVAQQCCQYLRASLLGLVFSVHAAMVHKGLLSMQIIFVPNLLEALTTLVSCLGTYILFAYQDLGMHALGMARSISSIFFWIILMIYVSCSSETATVRHHGIHGMSTSCFSHLSRCLPFFVQSALPCAMFMWFYEINSLLIGTLGAEQLAVHVIAFTVMSSIYQTVTQPFFSATHILVGTFLGSGKTQLAKQAALLCPIASIVANLLVCLIGYAMQTSLLETLAPAPSAHDLLRDLLCLVVIMLVIQAIQVCLSSVLLCMRKQCVVASTVPFTCYMVVWPIGYYLTFRMHQGAWGIWSASCFGCGLNCLVFGSVISGVDWEKSAVEGLEIIKEDAAKNESAELDQKTSEVCKTATDETAEPT